MNRSLKIIIFLVPLLLFIGFNFSVFLEDHRNLPYDAFKNTTITLTGSESNNSTIITSSTQISTISLISDIISNTSHENIISRPEFTVSSNFLSSIRVLASSMLIIVFFSFLIALMFSSVSFLAKTILKASKKAYEDDKQNKIAMKVKLSSLEQKESLRKEITAIIAFLEIKIASAGNSETDTFQHAVINAFQQLDAALSRFWRFSRPHYQTPMEFLSYLNSKFDNNMIDSAHFLEIIQLFYESAYRERTPTLLEIKHLVNNLKQLISD